MMKRMTQGLRALVTNSGLGCSQSSCGRYILRRLHENEELIFYGKTLPFSGRFKW
jgi:hypothetical protein